MAKLTAPYQRNALILIQPSIEQYRFVCTTRGCSRSSLPLFIRLSRLISIPGHILGPGRVGPGQGKARHRKWRPRPGPARLSGLKFLPKPGPSGVFFVGPSGFWAGPSQKRSKILPRPGPIQLSGHDFATQARPSGWKLRPRPEIFGPGFPCPGIVSGN
jgi:hypothetical protein